MQEKKFDVRFDPDALKEYRKLDKSVLPIVNKVIDELEYRADELVSQGLSKERLAKLIKRSKKWDVGKR